MCPEDLHVSRVILDEILAQPSYSEFCDFDPTYSSPILCEGKEQTIEVLKLPVWKVTHPGKPKLRMIISHGTVAINIITTLQLQPEGIGAQQCAEQYYTHYKDPPAFLTWMLQEG